MEVCKSGSSIGVRIDPEVWRRKDSRDTPEAAIMQEPVCRALRAQRSAQSIRHAQEKV